MKLWIPLALATLLIAIVLFDRQPSDNKAGRLQPQSAAIPDPPVLKRIKTPPRLLGPVARRKMAKKEIEKNKIDKREAEEENQAPSELLKWDSPKKLKFDPDPIMELRTTETVRPDDGPVLTITYGNEPKPNVRLEHRSWGNAPAAGFVADKDDSQ